MAALIQGYSLRISLVNIIFEVNPQIGIWRFEVQKVCGPFRTSPSIQYLSDDHRRRLKRRTLNFNLLRAFNLCLSVPTWFSIDFPLEPISGQTYTTNKIQNFQSFAHTFDFLFRKLNCSFHLSLSFGHDFSKIWISS